MKLWTKVLIASLSLLIVILGGMVYILATGTFTVSSSSLSMITANGTVVPEMRIVNGTLQYFDEQGEWKTLARLEELYNTYVVSPKEPQPTASPSPSPSPTPASTQTPEPTASPTSEPTDTPKPTPTKKPSATHKPTTTTKPIATPTPVITAPPADVGGGGNTGGDTGGGTGGDTGGGTGDGEDIPPWSDGHD
jgi:uncharacterized membrane protein YgcG